MRAFNWNSLLSSLIIAHPLCPSSIAGPFLSIQSSIERVLQSRLETSSKLLTTTNVNSLFKRQSTSSSTVITVFTALDAAQASQDSDSSSCTPGCLCSCITCRHIYFVNESSTISPQEQVVYLLRTNWIVYYPQQLRFALREAGLMVIDRETYSQRNILKCGWNRVGSYRFLGVKRGYMDVSGFNETSGGERDVLTTVHSIMRQQYPFVELTIILSTTLGLFVSSTVGWLISYLWYRKRVRDRSSKARLAMEKKQIEPSSQIRDKGLYEIQSTIITRQQMNTQSPLLCLPPEILLNITYLIEYPSLLSLRQCSTFFYAWISDSFLSTSRDQYSESLLADEIKSYEAIVSSVFLLCCQCLQKRRRCYFDEDQQRSSPNIRTCRFCLIRTGQYSYGKRSVYSVCAVPPNDPLHDPIFGPRIKIHFCGCCQKYIVEDKPNVMCETTYWWKDRPMVFCRGCVDRSTNDHANVTRARLLEVTLGVIVFLLSCCGMVPSFTGLWACTVALVRSLYFLLSNQNLRPN